MGQLRSTYLNQALMRIPRRAESVDRHSLATTFVVAGSLSAMLQSSDHQIIYGRRGTGKTHALMYLGDYVERCGDLAVHLDLRTIGSAGGLYSDSSLPEAQRGTQLLVDALEAIHEQLLAVAVEGRAADQDALLRALDALADAATAVEVVGEVEQETTLSEAAGADDGLELSRTPKLSVSRRTSASAEGRFRRSGVERHHVVFGPLSRALRDVVGALGGSRLWLLLDEWSSVPLELQPMLADLLRRSALPIQGITVKIAAIERRARFRLPGQDGDYVGIEVGADAATAVSLDDFMVFDDAPAQARTFFQQLFHNHAVPRLTPDLRDRITSPSAFEQGAFRKNAFAELVRAAEGVPRDAINIAALAAQHAHNNPIGVEDVRRAARDWYLRDKQSAITSHTRAHQLLRALVNEVVGRRRSRTFLVDQMSDSGILHDLYEARLLHVLRRGVVARRNPGTLYDGFAIDYGCYVALLLDDPGFDLPPVNFHPERSVIDLDELGRETGEPATRA